MWGLYVCHKTQVFFQLTRELSSIYMDLFVIYSNTILVITNCKTRHRISDYFWLKIGKGFGTKPIVTLRSQYL
jgi:hypothetical protein